MNKDRVNNTSSSAMDAFRSPPGIAFALALVAGFVAVNMEVTKPYMVSSKQP